MVRRIKKGNALVLVTVVMFAVSLIAASLTMYFAVANRVVEVSNRRFNKRIELSSEANNNYALLLKNEDITLDNSSIINLNNKIETELTHVEDKYTFVLNGYSNQFECIDYIDENNKVINYVISTIYKETLFSYEVEIILESGTYNLSTKEAFSTHGLS